MMMEMFLMFERQRDELKTVRTVCQNQNQPTTETYDRSTLRFNNKHDHSWNTDPLIQMFDTTDVGIPHELWMFVGHRHETHWVSFLYSFWDFLLFPSTQSCDVSAINSACVRGDELRQQLRVLEVHDDVAEETSSLRLFERVIHLNEHVLFLLDCIRSCCEAP